MCYISVSVCKIKNIILSGLCSRKVLGCEGVLMTKHWHQYSKHSRMQNYSQFGSVHVDGSKTAYSNIV